MKGKGFISDMICRVKLKTYWILYVIDEHNLSTYFLTVYLMVGSVQHEVGLTFNIVQFCLLLDEIKIQ